jgi:signal transduction histidine kinase
LILSQKPISDDDINIIEAISSQVSLSIHRRLIEKDLKASEARYRKLAEELEQKVKERTRELENINRQLNLELNERNLAEQALKKSEAQLKELNATKDKFFNIVAHDLKNPFTSLLGSTELLFENIHLMDKEQIRRLAQILNDSAKGGYAILQNLLDWSRSQTGVLKFNPEKFNLKDLIDENISNLQLFAANKEIYVNSEAENGTFVIADKNMMNTVVRNLLNNAIKFTHRGGKVNVRIIRNKKEIVVSVKDNGIGIPVEDIGKLFRIDTKFQVPGTDKEQGTGLGLKLCKEFIEKHNGKIWVRSTLNKGSEFKFSVPHGLSV